jgi:hypothetical protein
MNTFGADSLTARLASIFNVAPKVRLCNCGILWLVNIKTRVTLGTSMLIVDVICVVTAILLLRGFLK